MRLDKWLWFARLASSRAAARTLCESRHLRLDRRTVERPSAAVRLGQILVLPHGATIRIVRVTGLPARRGPYREACSNYEEIVPVIASETYPPLTGPHLRA